MSVIAYLYPAIPKESFNLLKKVMSAIYGYARKKIEDIHYHRNAVKVKDTKYLEDLNNL